MLLVIAIILTAIWAAAMAIGATAGGAVQALLVFAFICVIGHYLLPTTRRRDRNVVTGLQSRDDAALLRKRGRNKQSS